jgi:uncharacterized pyridoxamine 5'-phosphate oxidase family protein
MEDLKLKPPITTKRLINTNLDERKLQMEEVLKFLASNRPFYLATLDGTQARVRPMGFVMEFEKRLYFGAGNQKAVYRQMKANPQVEISATNSGAPDSPWLRLTGRVVFDDRPEVWAAALQAMPQLADIYPKTGESRMAAFFLENAEAIFYDMKGTVRQVKI